MMKHSREWYIPEGSTKITAKDCNATAYIYTASNGNPGAVIFLGNAQKPTKKHWYYTDSDRAKHVKCLFDRQKAREDARDERRATRSSTERGLEVGDVLRASWGYDQTNIDYYEVTALIGKKMVELREIASKRIETNWAQGECAPLVGEYTSEPFKKRAVDGVVRLESYKIARKIEPESNIDGIKTYAASHWTAYH